MKSKFIQKKIKYSGEQLSPLFAYMNFDLAGDSVISWMGPCDVSFEQMIDGEDLKELSAIRGDLMLHFVLEFFDRELFSAVLLQRLVTAMAKDLIEEMNPKVKILRKGDDLYYRGGKLSVSIASRSVMSCQIHLGINVTNAGTPVKTAALSDLKIRPQQFSKLLMKRISEEYESVRFATQKVRPLGE
jgi:hypothetical protein